MGKPELRDAGEADFAAVVALNAGEVAHTSPMDVSRLRELHSLAAYHRVVTMEASVAAFLLVMGEESAYANPNFEWFAARYRNFLYVDRIVVDRACQGLRLGSLLYENLFAHARSLGIGTIACEYNLVPPNEPSRRFHDRFGFQEVGNQWLMGGAKQVSLQVANVE